jgi:hypothetical protein
MRSLILCLIALGIFSMWFGQRFDGKSTRIPDLSFKMYCGGLLVIALALFGGTLMFLVGA